VTASTFMVVRGDDNGQNFIVQDGMDETSATALYQRLLRGHKQWYSIFGYATDAARQELVDRHNLRR